MTDLSQADDATALAALREPFPPELVGKLPRAGITLDYVGHGAVTHRLLEVDPLWTWEPVAFDADGLPRFTLDGQGNPIAFWIRLTVRGVTRLGCGTCNGNQFDAEKVLIGDALRNAAMRFGVALDLWIKGHAEDDERQHSTGAASRAPAPVGWAIEEAKAHIRMLAGGDSDMAKAAWIEVYNVPWTEEDLTAAYRAWRASSQAPGGIEVGLDGQIVDTGLPEPDRRGELRVGVVRLVQPLTSDQAAAGVETPNGDVEAATEPSSGQSDDPGEPFDREATARWVYDLDDVAVADLLTEYGLDGKGTQVAKRKRIVDEMERRAAPGPQPIQTVLD